ncbi:translation initiation factor IF-2 N-terminal domain-containing protein [Corynebacterium confusum]|uniref:translation initiation factor IF-2 N-terminal domain-containing protein n=1 Tax=Corynebacterium confusum TaxID=71254 RepID=UPI0025B2C45A|nr:translation initiation factor IF-2 N-terminal domain-containing protein [Corynebacterium confusum]WJY90306.1 Ribonuclease E [Corynebacterium confusum]
MAAKTKNEQNTDLSAAAALAERIGRSQLKEKTRLYALAKMLGISSKALVEQFAQQGIKKAPQSGLSKAEAEQMLDRIQAAGSQAPAGDAPSAATTDPEPEAQDAPQAKKKATKSTKSTKNKRKATTKGKRAATNSEKAKAEEGKSEEAKPEKGAPAEEQAEDNAADKSADKPKKTRKRATRKSTKKQAVRAAAPAKPQQQDEEPREQASDAEVPAGDEPKHEDSADAVATAAEEKLRDRVRKNVENEFNQIADKVESELQNLATTEASDGADDAEAAAGHGDQDGIGSTQADQADQTDTAQAEDEHADLERDEDLEDLVAALTPPHQAAAKDNAADYAPVFIAPQANAAKPARQAEPDDAGGDDDEPERIEAPRGIKGSTRIEAQKRRRAEMREKGRERKHIVSQAEFLARRESVERTMVVRERQRVDHAGSVTQVGVLEDDLLVEHFVTSDSQASLIGNIYLGRVQNVLPSMEAAFVDFGESRNGVLYAGELNWRAMGLKGRSRKIEQALKSGDQILVQVSKDPIGHKGARLTTQISLAGRFLVYVPNGRSAGISRKLPAPERKRLKEILQRVVPGEGGTIIRTAAENVSEEAIATDVGRLHGVWEDIQERAEKEKRSKGAKPVTLYEEPDMLVKVVRDLFNGDFKHLVVDGKKAFNTVNAYIQSVAPDLADRVERFDRKKHGGQDAFEVYRIDEQLQKALARKVWLPSGGTLVIDRTEAMTVIDVNTGKFTGSGGDLEETVTRNNLEAAEEIVRQMRLRDLGGMIVVDFIDMVLPENQELVLRRLKEALGRDRTRHQVSEVTSLGLVQMTRKRLGAGLLETFSTECEHCQGRGIITHDDPVEHTDDHSSHGHHDRRNHNHADSGQGRDQRSDEKQGSKSESRDGTKEIDQLVASVVKDDSAAHDGEDHDERNDRRDRDSEDRKGSSRRRRRRGSRGGRSNRSRDDQPRDDQSQDSVSDIEKIAFAAADNAADRDDVAEFKDYVPDEDAQPEQAGGATSYDEAVEEFESSPRRKRKTRGNSRSDHRPRREDFPRQGSGSAQPAASVQAQAEDAADDAGDSSPDQPARGKRGRRRATRRSGGQRGGRGNPRGGQSAPAQEQAPAQVSRAGSAVQAEDNTKTVVRGRRRRAVRRSTKAAQPEQAESGLARANQPRRDTDGHKAGGGAETRKQSTRGRRRATRRSRK